ncbi:hypothetical protein M3J09_012176 [Ascochyta lentis]
MPYPREQDILRVLSRTYLRHQCAATTRTWTNKLPAPNARDGKSSLVPSCTPNHPRRTSPLCTQALAPGLPSPASRPPRTAALAARPAPVAYAGPTRASGERRWLAAQTRGQRLLEPRTPRASHRSR